jgi:hypothetical protein
MQEYLVMEAIALGHCNSLCLIMNAVHKYVAGRHNHCARIAKATRVRPEVLHSWMGVKKFKLLAR